jgi:chemotaxis protein methyltransferase CheR
VSAPPLPPEALREAAAVVRERTGLIFPPSRQATLERAVASAMAKRGARELQQYLARVAADGDALDELIGEITVGETYFLRDPDQLALVAEELLAQPPGRSGGGPLRVWSAGCASGEEPYSLAIALHRLGALSRVRILATDISRAALARARRARYTRWSLRGVPPEVEAGYFRPCPEGFALAPEIRDAVEFRYLNLADDVYPSLASGVWGMDVVLCRNVLIYFSDEAVSRVARRLLATLGDGGWLVLGASDPVLTHRVPCETVVARCGLLYRRAASGSKATATLPSPPPAPLPVWPPQVLPMDAAPEPPPPPQALSDRVEPIPARADEPADAEGDAAPVDAAVARVRTLADAGRLEEAGRACAAALDKNRTSAPLLVLHAVLLTEAGRFAEAVRAARRALYLDRSLVPAHLALGVALARSADWPAARRAFRNAQRLIAALPADATVPGSDGERAGRMAELVRAHLELLPESAA